MNHFFLTGTSRGIGKAIAEALLEDPQNRVTGFSRTCSIRHERYTHVTMDLSDVASISAWKFPALKDASRIALVNNAGAIGAVKYAGRMEAATISRDYNVNLVAPAILTNAFLAAYSGLDAQQVIINVSSGAGKNPIDGWSVYCASKAGLDLFSRTVAEELKLAGKNHIRIFSVAPGIVDTAMQDAIREANKLDFSRVGQFVDYKVTGQLASPDLIARKYLSILGLPEKFPDVVFSVRDI
jgi:benzil reductase ((S)-benzoin forming)